MVRLMKYMTPCSKKIVLQSIVGHIANLVKRDAKDKVIF